MQQLNPNEQSLFPVHLRYLHVSKGIVVFSGAEGVELVARAEEALHHDRVGGRRAHVVLTQELQQVLVVVP